MPDEGPMPAHLPAGAQEVLAYMPPYWRAVAARAGWRLLANRDSPAIVLEFGPGEAARAGAKAFRQAFDAAFRDTYGGPPHLFILLDTRSE